MEKRGKGYKKKHLSKEAFRKITMWRVYKHKGKVKDYEVYKEALHAATNEVRKTKRNSEHKFAQLIKSYSKRSWGRIFLLAPVVLKVVKNKYHRNNLLLPFLPF